MGWTSADVLAVEQAIRDLAEGNRTTRCRFASGAETEYAQTDLAKLEALRDRMRAEVTAAASTATSRRSFVITGSTKGL